MHHPWKLSCPGAPWLLAELTSRFRELILRGHKGASLQTPQTPKLPLGRGGETPLTAGFTPGVSIWVRLLRGSHERAGQPAGPDTGGEVTPGQGVLQGRGCGDTGLWVSREGAARG